MGGGDVGGTPHESYVVVVLEMAETSRPQYIPIIRHAVTDETIQTKPHENEKKNTASK